LCLGVATVALALSGCKQAAREGAAPRADAGAGAIRVDCDALLFEQDIERICEVSIVRRTAAWGEGWSPAPACDRKFFTDRGAVLGFWIHRFSDPALALADYRAREPRARSLPGFKVVENLGVAGRRFVDRVAGGEAPTVAFVEGESVVTLSAFRQPADGSSGDKACGLQGTLRLARLVAARLRGR
jgi:hypothetical protein